MQTDTRKGDPVAEPLTKADFEALAQFRCGIRRYPRFREQAVRAVHVELTRRGERAMARPGALHRDELRRARTALTLPGWDGPAGGEA